MTVALRVQTHVWGPNGRRRALLIHGLGSDGACWWRLAEQLAEDGWLVVAPDLRGHGRSPSAGDLSIRAMTTDLVQLGRDWDLVVGHSLGGALAVELLAGSSEAARGLLIDPVLEVDDQLREEVRRSLHAECGGIDPGVLAAEHPGWDQRDVWRKALAARWLTPDVVDGVLDQNEPWPTAERLASVAGRLHVLAGDPAAGGLLDVARTRTLLGQAGDRHELHVVAGAGHSIHRDDPAAITDAVAALLAG